MQSPLLLHVYVPVQAFPVVSSTFVTFTSHDPVDPQFRQVGQTELVQQKPSTHVRPVWHCVVLLQVPPALFRTQAGAASDHAPLARHVLVPTPDRMYGEVHEYMALDP